MSRVILSYVLTTYNKFSYLKNVIELLLENIKDEEEIVVVDGGSTDGTCKYLEELFSRNKVHQYISEKDFGEAHGFNKGIMMAKGELIKILTDDDVFDYYVIRKCKEYLIENPSIDALFSNIASINSTIQVSELTLVKNYQVWFQNWASGLTKNCFICCLPLMMRKKAFSNTGLFDTSFKHTDLEFSVRLTSKKVNVAFCTALMVCANINSKSISQVASSTGANEVSRVANYYDYNYPLLVKEVDKPGRVSSFINRGLKFVRLFKNRPLVSDYNVTLEQNILTTNLIELTNKLVAVMANYNRNNSLEFFRKLH